MPTEGTGSARLVAHAAASLVYGMVGDAMGTPTENLEPAEIEARYGWVDSFEGDGTDDSIMARLIADALVESRGYATADDWARQCTVQKTEIFGPKLNRFFASVTHSIRKLDAGYIPRIVATGNMPSSSSAMAIAPVGIVNAGNPRAAAAQAQEIASFLHVGEVAFCQDGAGAIAAAVAAALAPNASVDGVLTASTAYLKPWSGKEMLGRIERALELAATGDYKAFRDAYHREFRCAIACDSRETVPATLAITALAQGDPEQAVIYGANFGRDADTIACMAGYVCGALRGVQTGGRLEVPTHMIERATGFAERLVAVARDKAAAEIEAWSNATAAA